jgi:hypothetical protein
LFSLHFQKLACLAANVSPKAAHVSPKAGGPGLAFETWVPPCTQKACRQHTAVMATPMTSHF